MFQVKNHQIYRLDGDIEDLINIYILYMSKKTRKKKDTRQEKNKTKLNKTFKKYNKNSAYPWKKITKKMALDDFKGLKKVDEMNWRSTKGIRMVDYGSYKLRMRTKYRGKSNVERWNNKVSREK